MEEEIVKKLKSALSEPIKKECQVIYILAEIRKLLDRLRDKTILPVLRFYSNWALHIEIDDTSAVRSLLEKIEQTILSRQYDIDAVMAIIDFEKFREEINIFLNKFNINNPFLKRKYWTNFRRSFVDVLIDCPLKPKNSEIKEFRFIKSSGVDDVDYKITFKNHIPIRGSFTFLDAEAISEKHRKSF